MEPAMGSYTPPQIKVLAHIRKTGQSINIDANGMAYMMDGTRVNRMTLRALLRKKTLAACGSDLFGDGVTAYTISSDSEKEIQDVDFIKTTG